MGRAVGEAGQDVTGQLGLEQRLGWRQAYESLQLLLEAAGPGPRHQGGDWRAEPYGAPSAKVGRGGPRRGHQEAERRR